MYKEVEFDYACSPSFREYEDYLNGGPNYTVREPVKTNDPDNSLSIRRTLSKLIGLQTQQGDAIKELKNVRPYKKKVYKYI